jgi:hypothetical protein
LATGPAASGKACPSVRNRSAIIMVELLWDADDDSAAQG